MTLENSIKDTISKKLEDGTVEKLIEQQLEKGVVNALENLFRSYGDITKIIENKVKSVMVPYLESYDYSKYITKLDSVLVDVLKNSSLENKQLLQNFKDIMTTEEQEKSMNVSELYEKWMNYVAEEVSTNDLEVICDDGVSYECVDVKLEVDYSEDRNWSIYEYANLIFECGKDEDMNQSIRLYRWKESSDKGWDVERHESMNISSLRYLNKFELLLMKLSQGRTKLFIDTDFESDEVQPEAEPEATFS
ncbi:MAG: hypothetical protein ACQEXX_01115 [Bacillota bacterium]